MGRTVRVVVDAAQPTEAALLAAVARGDAGALRELHGQYAGPIFALALRMLADRELAEDVVQDVFVRVWRHAGTFDPARGKAATWLYGLARHLAIDQIRRRKVHALPMASTDEGETYSNLVPDPTVDVERDVWGAEQRALLGQAIGTLPAAQQHVIVQAYYRGLTQAEIAATTGIPLGTVKTRLRLGLTKLRDALHHQGLSQATA